MNSSIVLKRNKSHAMLYDFAGLVSFCFLFAFNALAWSQDFNAAIWAAQVTTIGLAVIGLIGYAIRTWGKSRTENYLERSRARHAIRREEEKLNRDSLEFKNNELLERINDINKKFHKQSNEFQIQYCYHKEETLNHKEESNRLMAQLKLIGDQLNETIDMLKEERYRSETLQIEINKFQQENRSLIAQRDSIYANQIKDVQKQITNNKSQITEIRKDM